MPVDAMVLVVIVMPCAVAVFFGAFAFNGMAPLAFHCGRCQREFRRKAYRDFPRRCPMCGARDWNRT
jgi:uncharacterized CHY-type Zn-finger protein